MTDLLFGQPRHVDNYGNIIDTDRPPINYRLYNFALAFGVFIADVQTFAAPGPKICGQVHHNVYSLHPLRDDCQLYFYDRQSSTK